MAYETLKPLYAQQLLRAFRTYEDTFDQMKRDAVSSKLTQTAERDMVMTV